VDTGDCCFACIFHNKSKTTDYYVILINDSDSFELFEKARNVDQITQIMLAYAPKVLDQSDLIQYYIKFVFCSTDC